MLRTLSTKTALGSPSNASWKASIAAFGFLRATVELASNEKWTTKASSAMPSSPLVTCSTPETSTAWPVTLTGVSVTAR